MTQDIGNFALIKNELLRKVVMYYVEVEHGSIKAVSEFDEKNQIPQEMLHAFTWRKTEPYKGDVNFWPNIYFRLKKNPATELTQSELKTLQPIIDKINEQCK